MTSCNVASMQGFGETDMGGGADPFETGSYDLALEDAGIENFNITTYTCKSASCIGKD